MQLMSIKIGLLSVLLLKTCVREQTMTRSYYFEPPLSKKRSRATVQDYCGKITNNDIERDDLLQNVEQHRKTKVMTKKQSFSDV